MELSFWQERWQRGEIGFHLPRPHPKLLALWPQCCPEPTVPVFVPLCGKSLDLLWLLGRGHRVIGVELSELAVHAFFAEHGLTPQRRTVDGFELYEHDGLQLFCGDYFALPADVLRDCRHVYDRAALVALPADMRARYVAQMRRVLPHARQLLLTLVYPQHEMNGPPFSVPAVEVEHLYADAARECLIDQDILSFEPRFQAKGVSSLHEQAWSLAW